MSIVMVAVGLWIRLGILETPVFQRILAENKVERAPTIEGPARPNGRSCRRKRGERSCRGRTGPNVTLAWQDWGR